MQSRRHGWVPRGGRGSSGCALDDSRGRGGVDARRTLGCGRARATRPSRTRSRARTRSPATRRASGTSAAPATPTSRASPPTSASTRARPSHFKIDTDATDYRIDIYRLGYYGGDGARKVATVAAVGARCRRRSPPCLTDAATGLVDCGNWAESASWAVPADAVSGIYIAKLVREDDDGRREPHRLRRARRRRRLGPPVPDLRHDLAGLQPATAATASTPASPAGPRVQGELQPAVHDARRPRPRTGSSTPSTRWCAGSSQRLRRQLHHRRRQRPARRRAARARGLPVGRPRRVLVGRASARTSRRRATPACTSPSSAATRSSGRRAGSRASTARARRTARSSPTRRRTRTRKIDPTAGRLDRHLARPALQPARRRRPARERADRHDLHGQLLHDDAIDGARPTTASCASGATRASPTLAAGQTRDASPTARSATSGTRTSTTAPGPPGSIRLVDHDRRRAAAPPGPRLDLRAGHGDAPPDAVPARERRARVRRRHGAVVVGPRRHARPRRLDAATPRMQQATVNLFADMGVAAGDAAGRARRRDARRPTRRAPTLDDHLARGRRDGRQRARRSRSPAPRPTRRRRGRRRRGLDRRRRDLAPGHRARELDATRWTPEPTGSRHDPGARRRRQRQPRGAAAPASTVDGRPAARPARARIWDDARRRRRGEQRQPAGRARRQVPRRRRRLRHRRSASTRAPANTGTHVGHLWTTRRHAARQRDLHRRDRRPAGRRSSFGSPVAITAGHDLRRLVPRAERPLRRRRRLLRRHGRRQPAAARARRRRGRAERRLPLRRRAAASRPTRFNSANYWVDVVFDDDVGPDDDAAARRRDRRPATARSASRHGANVTATFNEAMDAGDDLRRDVRAARRRRTRSSPATCPYDAGHAHGDARPDRARSPHSTTYTATRQGRRGGVTDLAGNALAADVDVVVHDRGAAAAAARRGPGRTDPRDRQRVEPVRPLLRRDPARRGPERVHGHRHLARHAGDARRATTSSILGEMPLSAGAGRRCSTNWVDGRRQPDRDAARQAARRPARADRRRRRRSSNALPAGRHAPAPGRGHRRPDDPVPRHRRPLHAERRDRASRRSTRTRTTATANPAVTLRSVGAERRPGRGVHLRPRALGRLHAPGQPGLGGPGARRHRADPLRRPVLRRRRVDPQPDWVDLDKVAIPQADEQQRLLANLIAADEPRPQAAAALLVLPARREGGRRDDRRRPRQRRHRPAASTSYDRRRARRAARSPTGSASAARRTSTRARR